MPAWPSILLGTVYGAVGVAAWIMLLVGVAAITGWRRMAAVYGGGDLAGDGHEPQFAGQHLNGRFGCGYGGCVTVTAGTHALGLRVWLVFRPGHPPLTIPWDDVRFTERRSRILGLSSVEMEFSRVPGVRWRVSRKLVRKLALATGRPLLSER